MSHQRTRKSRHKDRWILAEHEDGLSFRHARWTLSIDPTGLVTQDGTLEDENGHVAEIRHELMLDAVQLRSMRNLTENFLDDLSVPPAVDRQMTIDDAEHQKISIWDGEVWHSRCLRGARHCAHSGEIDAQRFIDVWDSIHEYAAFR